MLGFGWVPLGSVASPRLRCKGVSVISVRHQTESKVRFRPSADCCRSFCEAFHVFRGHTCNAPPINGSWIPENPARDRRPALANQQRTSVFRQCNALKLPFQNVEQNIWNPSTHVYLHYSSRWGELVDPSKQQP